jgi:uncharacterized protein (DUF169 family)
MKYDDIKNMLHENQHDSLFQPYTNSRRELIDEKEASIEILKSFNELLHLTPVGVKFYFHKEAGTICERPDEPIRFCQAVDYVNKTSRNLLLKKDDISCPAARIVLGFKSNEDILIECADRLVDSGRFKDEASAIQVLSDVPRIRGEICSVLLSSTGILPDTYILQSNPSVIMRVVQAYQRVYAQPLRFEVTGVMPVCGNCAVRPYVTNEICVSFGCDDSRKYGDIPDSNLVMGMPFLKAVSTLRSLAEMREKHETPIHFVI